MFGADSECTEACPGDPVHICGDGNRLTTYFWNRTAPLTTWNTPSNIGQYEVGTYLCIFFLLFPKYVYAGWRLARIYFRPPFWLFLNFELHIHPVPE